MKQKFFNAAVVLVILVLSFGLSNQAGAQTTEGTKAQTQANTSTAHQYMQTPATNTGVYKTQDGLAEVDANGNVTLTTINASGESQVSVVIRPVVNTAVEIGTDMEQYIANYIQWMKANPDFKSYVSAQELAFINSGDYEHLYKTNFLNAQSQSLRNK